MPADLHVHTYYSDGLLSPEAVVAKAAENKLATMAITDHDIVAGIDPAAAEGAVKDVKIIPGIELTAESNDAEIHILGYFLDYHNAALLEVLQKIQQDREERIGKIVNNLKAVGVHLETEAILESSKPGTVGRPHVARMLIAKGYAQDFKEAFMKFLVKGQPGYVPHYRLDPVEAVRLIRSCKGAAVFAHPALSKSDALIPTLVEAGMAGLEAFHASHNFYTEQKYVKLAEQYNLVVTGGTDFHGGGGLNEMPLGTKFTSDENVQKLKERADG